MRWFRRIGITLLSLAVIGVVGWLTMPYWVPIVAKRLEPFIRAELTAILGEYLEPTVTIERIEYQWPLKVVARGVQMTATDPSTGKPLEILGVDRMLIELDRIPSSSEPLVFRDFTLDGPKLVFHATTNGDLVGWDNLLKDAGTQSANRRPSEIFAIDVITVTNFTVEYSMEDYEEKMVLDQLDFTLDNQAKKEEKTVDLPQGPGWYAIDTTLKREGLFSIELLAGLDIDSLNVDVEKLKLDLVIDKTSQAFLPPQVQQFMADHDVESRMDVNVRAQFNIGDIVQSDAAMHVELGQSHFAVGDRIMEVDSATADFIYTDARLFTDNAKVTMLGGEIDATLNIQPASEAEQPATSPGAPSGPAEQAAGLVPQAAIARVTEVASGLELTSSITLKDLKIQEIHRSRETGKQEEGNINGTVELQANLGDAVPSLTGSGEIDVTDGRFEMTPLIRALAGVMKIVSLDFGGSDTVNATFTIADERVNISSLRAVVGPIGARGRGWIGFDRTLELRFNAGPLERLQESTGPIGQIFGAITDTLLDYVASGTLSDPTIRIAPLGIGMDDASPPAGNSQRATFSPVRAMPNPRPSTSATTASSV